MFKNKKYKMIILAALLLLTAVFGLLPPAEVYAASVCVEFSASDFIVEGEEFKLEINFKADETIGDLDASFRYDTNILEYVTGPSCVSEEEGIICIRDAGEGSSNGEKTFVLTFLAKKAGECEITAFEKPVVYGYNDNSKMAVSVTEKIVSIRSTATLSGDTSLKDMQVYDVAGNPIRISPEFISETFDYGAKVPFAITKIVIVATTNDKHATVEVSGEAGLRIGSNSVKVLVTAENGQRETYTILVIREGLESADVDDQGIPVGLTPTPYPEPTATSEPINPLLTQAALEAAEKEPEKGVHAESGKYGITINEYHTYTSVSDAKNLSVPSDCKETKLYIDSIAVLAYESPELPSDILLVPLKNEAGDIRWYTYDRVEQTFQKLNDTEVKYVTVKADYNEELLETLEEYEKKQLQLLIIAGVCAAGCVILLVLLLKNLFSRKE